MSLFHCALGEKKKECRGFLRLTDRTQGKQESRHGKEIVEVPEAKNRDCEKIRTPTGGGVEWEGAGRRKEGKGAEKMPGSGGWR